MYVRILQTLRFPGRSDEKRYFPQTEIRRLVRKSR